MKIGIPASGIQELSPLTPAGSSGRSAADEAAKAAGSASSAKVELSATATGLLSGVKNSPAEFNAEKVARISQAIADGTFKVNPEAIADKLIANAQEVLGAVKR